MTRRKCIFRADSGPSVGMGHFFRCLSLAIELKKNHEVVFYLNSGSADEEKILQQYQLACIFIDRTNESSFLEVLTGNEIVVLDGYIFNQEFHTAIKKKNCTLIHIDDLASFHQVADIVINHSANAPSLSYQKATYTKLLLGLEYVLLRPFFMGNHEIAASATVNRYVFLSMGGSDEHNLTGKLANWCAAIPEVETISVVTGSYYKHEKELEVLSPKIRVYKNLDEVQMGECMLKADVVVCPASGTVLEAIALRKPCLCGYSAGNQITNFNGLNEKDVFVPLGNLMVLTQEHFHKAFSVLTPAKKQACSEVSQKTIDKKSVLRITAEIEKLSSSR